MTYPPRRVAYLLIGILFGSVIWASGFAVGGYSLHPTRTIRKPALCKGDKFSVCLAELVGSQTGGITPSVTCNKVEKRRRLYYCDTGVTGSCYDVVAYMAYEGFPLIQSASERNC